MVFLSVGRSFRPLITQTEFSSSRNRISVFEFLLRWFLLDKIIQILLEIRNLAHWICPKMLLHLKILPENFRGGTGFGVFDVRKVGFLIFSSKKSEILFLLDGNPVCVRSGLRAFVIVQQKSEYRIIRLSDYFEFSMLSRRGIRGPIIKNQWDPGSKNWKTGGKRYNRLESCYPMPLLGSSPTSVVPEGKLIIGAERQ